MSTINGPKSLRFQQELRLSYTYLPSSSSKEGGLRAAGLIRRLHKLLLGYFVEIMRGVLSIGPKSVLIITFHQLKIW